MDANLDIYRKRKEQWCPMFYQDVFSALFQNNVRYAVAGGVAVNLHGLPRMTADLDLVLDLQRENLKRFLVVMEQLGYRPRLPVSANDLLEKEKRTDWIANRNLHAFTFWKESKQFQEIDVLIRISEDPEIVNRAEVVKIDAISIYVATIDDLVEMKRSADRKQDKADVEALLKLKSLL